MASVRTRILTGLTLASVVVFLLWVASVTRPGLVPFLVGFALALLSLVELGRMGKLAAKGRTTQLVLLGLLSAAAALRYGGRELSPVDGALLVLALQGLVLVLGGLFSLALARLCFGRPATRLDLAPGPLAAWVAPPLLALGVVHTLYGTGVLATLITLSKIGDVAGYLVGRSIGRSHPFPRLSPGKTTAGCVASLVTGTVGGAVAGALGLLPGAPAWWQAALVGVALNVAAQAADLLESAVKRYAGVKDASRLAGASGGVLDVVDSLLLTLPAALVLFALIS